MRAQVSKCMESKPDFCLQTFCCSPVFSKHIFFSSALFLSLSLCLQVSILLIFTQTVFISNLPPSVCFFFPELFPRLLNHGLSGLNCQPCSTAEDMFTLFQGHVCLHLKKIRLNWGFQTMTTSEVSFVQGLVLARNEQKLLSSCMQTYARIFLMKRCSVLLSRL